MNQTLCCDMLPKQLRLAMYPAASLNQGWSQQPGPGKIPQPKESLSLTEISLEKKDFADNFEDVIDQKGKAELAKIFSSCHIMLQARDKVWPNGPLFLYAALPFYEKHRRMQGRKLRFPGRQCD